jgi:hypothetical protein
MSSNFLKFYWQVKFFPVLLFINLYPLNDYRVSLRIKITSPFCQPEVIVEEDATRIFGE